MSSGNPLPIDPLLGDIVDSLAGSPVLLLQAEPGAGKTTRVPLVLLNAPFLAGKKILMLEPRRVATVHAARYLAASLGEEVGQTVGYRIRFEQKVSAKTRIEIVTEGILTRRLQSDPELADVGLVIFDEFHERSIHADLGLALCRDVQLGLRDDLRLLVMSATLDVDRLSRLLDDAPTLHAPGRSHPIDLRYVPSPDPRQLIDLVATTIQRALKDEEGDLLAFLPGAGEIRRCADALGRILPAGLREEIAILPLHGGIPFPEQQRALRPQTKRRVILATNIAESSLTIDGVRVVVDSGMERRPRFDADLGGIVLETRRISAASAAQRAGRSGRQGPGLCYRIWSEGVQGGLIPFAPPEIALSDPSSLVLSLLGWGVPDPADLVWLDPPTAGQLASGRAFLRLLGALGADGSLTAQGRGMADLPTEPRFAAMLIAGERLHALPLVIELVALLSETDLLCRDRELYPSGCDLTERLELLHRFAADGRAPGVDPVVARRVLESIDWWCRRYGIKAERKAVDGALLAQILMCGFPDRVARKREGGYLTAAGKGVSLSKETAVGSPKMLVAVGLRRIDQGDIEVMLASRIEQDEVETLLADRIETVRSVTMSEEGKVQVFTRRTLGALELSRKSERPGPDDLIPALLAHIRSVGLSGIDLPKGAGSLLRRMVFCSCHTDGLPSFEEATLLDTLEDWLVPYLQGVKGVAGLAGIDWSGAFKNRYGWQHLADLDRLAPERIEVPSGSNIQIDYGQDPPVLRIRLQEMFGCRTTPTIADGRVPLMLHLLSPAQRPVQVTQDLCGFWQGAYQEVKKELKGRYPKHQWPDDPDQGIASAKTKKRLGV